MPDLEHYEALTREIIRLLEEERKTRKLSRYAVFKRSGVSQAMLSLVERGLRNPTMELVLRMADAIEVDLPAIIKTAKGNLEKNPRRQRNGRKNKKGDYCLLPYDCTVSIK